MHYTVSDIQTLLAARALQLPTPQAPVEQLLLDSRHITAPGRSLFFALPGKRHDGHAHLDDLYRAGVRNFLVSKPLQIQQWPEANILQVENSLDALQQLAAAHRKRFQIPVVGITGSNGKTIVKEWLYQLLAPDFNIVRSPKSYNSQVGVPLSVWQMQPRHTLALFEAGISQPGEMERLASIIRPTIGIFTNIGPAHHQGFTSKMEKVREKMRLFDETDTLIYCMDQAKVAEAVGLWEAAVRKATPAYDKTSFGRTGFSWSRTGKPADIQVLEVHAIEDGSTQIVLENWDIDHDPTKHTIAGQPAILRDFSALHQPSSTRRRFTFAIPFQDEASIENAIHCWALLYWLGIPPDLIRERMARLEPVEMRLELKAGVNRCTLINDSYNNDLSSLRIALQFAAQQARTGRFTLILSDILQSGQSDEVLYEKVAIALQERGITRFIGIGSAVASIQAKLPSTLDAVFYPDTNAFLQNIGRHDFHDELILLKGARPFEFERIAQRLEQKAHKTVLEVNLSALVHNLNVYNRLLKPGTKMLAMVKAAAYGSGSAEIAKLLEFHKVDYLGVAYTDEGIELRQAGITLPILVLNPEPAGFDALYRYRLEPEVYSLHQLKELIRFAGHDKRLAIHLKLDTGMHRLGFEGKDIAALTEQLRDYPNLQVRSIFSHLSASDAPAHDAFTHRQASLFSDMYTRISSALETAPLRHIVNTGGIARFPDYHFDMVRLGIGLYGIDSSGLQDQLRVVNTLKATISQIKDVQPGETVGYNRNGLVLVPGRIATISIGYADGFLRLAGSGRFSVLIHGHKAPTIGNVCMDMTMVDVTHVPAAREGDTVIVFGENHPVQELAKSLQTIPYEVFTNISERVKRVYWQE